MLHYLAMTAMSSAPVSSATMPSTSVETSAMEIPVESSATPEVMSKVMASIVTMVMDSTDDDVAAIITIER